MKKIIRKIIKEELKSIIKESKSILNEKFASRKIASLFGKVGKWGKDKTFLDDMARQYGVQWDQLTDDMVKGPDTRIDNKGIDIVIASKDTEIPEVSEQEQDQVDHLSD